MSKVISQITARLTGKRGAEVSPLLAVSFEKDSMNTPVRFDYHKEYDLSVKLGYRVWLNEDVSAKEEEYALRKAKYAVTDYIFGEFREPLHDLYMAINNRDSEKALVILQNIERQMFEIKENEDEQR
jgi:hypothetical protein